MCEYCNKRADNKKQFNIDNECEEFYRVFLSPKQNPLLSILNCFLLSALLLQYSHIYFLLTAVYYS